MPPQGVNGEVLATDERDCFFRNMRHAARRVSIELWSKSPKEMEEWGINSSDAHGLAQEILTTMRHQNPYLTAIRCQGWTPVAPIADAIRTANPRWETISEKFFIFALRMSRCTHSNVW